MTVISIATVTNVWKDTQIQMGNWDVWKSLSDLFYSKTLSYLVAYGVQLSLYSQSSITAAPPQPRFVPSEKNRSSKSQNFDAKPSVNNVWLEYNIQDLTSWNYDRCFEVMRQHPCEFMSIVDQNVKLMPQCNSRL